MENSSNSDLKRVIAVNDMSCFGKCSLTVALPIISSLSVEAVPLPTSILSTHTGGFTGFTRLDMTEEMKKIIAHWKTVDFRCDGIYTGYFTSPEQIDISFDFIKEFSNPGTIVLVDPVMADNGKLYTGFDMTFADDMARLCAAADVITPNITEALLLTGLPYSEIQEWETVELCISRLEELGAKSAVITGVRLENESIGYVCRKFEEKHTFKLIYPFENMRLHGCGDVFASALIGLLVEGNDFQEAIYRAADFTERCIKVTSENLKEHWYGLEFEKVLTEGI